MAGNAPVAGSAPPQPTAVLGFLDEALSALLPSVAEARAAAAHAAKALAEEEREVGHI